MTYEYKSELDRKLHVAEAIRDDLFRQYEIAIHRKNPDANAYREMLRGYRGRKGSVVASLYASIEQCHAEIRALQIRMRSEA